MRPRSLSGACRGPRPRWSRESSAAVGEPVWSPRAATAAAPQALRPAPGPRAGAIPSSRASMNPAQNASPAPTGSTTDGDRTGPGRTAARPVRPKRQRAAGPELHAPPASGPSRRSSLGEVVRLGVARPRRSRRAASSVSAITTSHPVRERPAARGRASSLRPQPPAQVQIEAHGRTGGPDGVERGRRPPHEPSMTAPG